MRSGTGCWTTTSSSTARASRTGWTGHDMNAFKAFRIHEREGRIVAGFEQMNVDGLTAGDVVIRVQYSSINYKDALAGTGAGKILRKYPLNGGIDLAGEVASSSDSRFRVGMPVLVTGCGLSETFDGGYAEYARVAGNSVFELPMGLSAEQSKIGRASCRERG